MTNDSKEFIELYELNVELLETLLLVGQQLLDYADKYSISLEGKQRLIFLVRSARKTMEEIAQPYRGNPIKPLDSGRKVTPLRDRRQGNSTVLEAVLPLCLVG
jgi:hypothetical protein